MRSKMPGGSGVATLADSEIITAKRALTIVTSHAAWPATGGVMVERFRRSDLFSLGHAGAHLMTLVASNFLMLRMVEADFECRRELRSARITTQLMAGPTRRDVSAIRLRAWRVAAITG